MVGLGRSPAGGPAGGRRSPYDLAEIGDVRLADLARRTWVDRHGPPDTSPGSVMIDSIITPGMKAVRNWSRIGGILADGTPSTCCPLRTADARGLIAPSACRSSLCFPVIVAPSVARRAGATEPVPPRPPWPAARFGRAACSPNGPIASIMS